MWSRYLYWHGIVRIFRCITRQEHKCFCCCDNMKFFNVFPEWKKLISSPLGPRRSFFYLSSLFACAIANKTADCITFLLFCLRLFSAAVVVGLVKPRGGAEIAERIYNCDFAFYYCICEFNLEW